MTYLVPVTLKKTLVVKADGFAGMVEEVKSRLGSLKVLDTSDPQDQKFDDEFKAHVDIWGVKEVV